MAESKIDERSQRIVSVFNDLNKDNLDILDKFYHPDVLFEDPVGKINSRVGIKQYYAKMYKNVKSIKFEFSEIVAAGDKHVAIWKMTLETPSLNGGDPFSVDGNSIIKFDPAMNLVIYHRDYFDMGAFIYERVPVLKYIIKKLREQLAH